MVTLDDFLTRLEFKPKYEPKGPLEGFSTSIVVFETVNGIAPHVEFGTVPDEKTGKQYFYFEGIDENRYSEGEFIPLDSDLRLHPIYVALDSSNVEETAAMVNGFLREFSGGTRK